MVIAQIIFFILTNWREIYRLVKAIADLIKNSKDKEARLAFTSELSKAVQTYSVTRDKRPLEALLCKIKGQCG